MKWTGRNTLIPGSNEQCDLPYSDCQVTNNLDTDYDLHLSLANLRKTRWTRIMEIHWWSRNELPAPQPQILQSSKNVGINYNSSGLQLINLLNIQTKGKQIWHKKNVERIVRLLSIFDIRRQRSHTLGKLPQEFKRKKLSRCVNLKKQANILEATNLLSQPAWSTNLHM